MRHGDKVNNLGRKKAHRKALLSNLASQLIVHKRIITSLAKAKALRTFVEPLLTKTKKGQTKEQISHQHRIVFSYLQDKEATKELFTVVGPKISSRPGGYTRILKLGIRVGDNSEKAMIELVDFNDVYGKTASVTTEQAKKTRRGRAPKKAADASAPAVVEDAIEVKDEKAPEVAPVEEVALKVAPVQEIAPEANTEAKSAE